MAFLIVACSVCGLMVNRSKSFAKRQLFVSWRTLRHHLKVTFCLGSNRFSFIANTCPLSFKFTVNSALLRDAFLANSSERKPELCLLVHHAYGRGSAAHEPEAHVREYHLTLDRVLFSPWRESHCHWTHLFKKNLGALFVWSNDTVQHLIKVMMHI